MTKNLSLTDFINEQITKFNIQNDEKVVLKLRQKFQRELKKLGIWDNPTEIKLVDRAKTKFFSIEQMNRLYSSVELYLLKISNTNIDDFKKYKEDVSNYKDYILSDDYIEDMKKNYEDENNPFKATITKNEKLEFMIEALFNKFYEPIDEEQWIKDKELNLIVDDYDEEWAGSFDVYNARKRLNNKIKSYTKERKS